MRVRSAFAILMALLATACPFGGGGGGAVTVGEDDADDDAAEPGPAPTSTPRRREAAVAPAAFSINILPETQIDFGATGQIHGLALPTGTQLSMDVACLGEGSDFHDCALYGPRNNAAMIDGAPSNQRCVDANGALTGVECSDDTACGAGTCRFFLSAPLHILRSDSDQRCVIPSYADFPALVGVWDPVESTLSLEKIRIRYDSYTVRESYSNTCPLCTAPEGSERGVCAGGRRDGQSCRVFGSNREDMGATSLDCPPNATDYGADISSEFVIPAMSASPSDSYVEWVVGSDLPTDNGFYSLCGTCGDGTGCASDSDCSVGFCRTNRSGEAQYFSGCVGGNTRGANTCEAVDAFSGVCQDDATIPCFNSTSIGQIGSSLRARNGFNSSSDAWLGTPMCIGNPTGSEDLEHLGLPGPGRVQLHFSTTTLPQRSGLAMDHELDVAVQLMRGSPGGKIVSEIAAIDCGATCNAQVPVNTEVVLTPVANAGAWLAEWYGDADCLDGTVSMTRAHSCYARFGPVLAWDDDSLSVTDRQGRNVTTAARLTTTGTDGVFSLSSSAPWLTFSYLGEQTPKNINIRADADGLAVGTYTATITASMDPAYRPATLTVTFTVTP